MTTANMIKGKSGLWEIRKITVEALSAMAPHLPAAQKVRGSVWPVETSTKLVDDLRTGKYIPPLVLAGDADTHDVSDGQQRLTAILAAFKEGMLTGTEEVPLAIDAGRSFKESFKVLNVGVPVGAGLVAAMKYTGSVSDAVIQLSTHPLFAEFTQWTATQKARTASADYASAALAVMAGWGAPESSTKATIKWLDANGAVIDEGIVKATCEVLDAIAAALYSYNANKRGKTDENKNARAILAQARKKSMFMTLVSVVATSATLGVDMKKYAADAVVCLARPDLLEGQTYTYVQEFTDGKGKVKTVQKTAKWFVGGGSSGSSTEFRERCIVLTGAIKLLPTHKAQSVEVVSTQLAAKVNAALEAHAADPAEGPQEAETEAQRLAIAVGVE